MPNSSPVIADLNNDGKIELVITGLFDGGSVNVFSLGTKYDPSKLDWPTLDHDNMGSSSYDPPKSTVNLPSYDFNCDNKFDSSDINVISDLWRNGTKIDTALVTQKGQQCKNLGNYLGGLLQQGITTMPISEVTRIGAVLKAGGPQATPRVITSPPTDITAKSIVPHGNIIDIGGAPVTKRGFRLTKIQNTAQADYGDTGSFGVGEFTKTNVTLAVPNTTYYIQAYATNSAGTTYGDWVTFKSLPLVTP
jgi:hypothetical protein